MNITSIGIINNIGNFGSNAGCNKKWIKSLIKTYEIQLKNAKNSGDSKAIVYYNERINYYNNLLNSNKPNDYYEEY